MHSSTGHQVWRLGVVLGEKLVAVRVEGSWRAEIARDEGWRLIESGGLRGFGPNNKFITKVFVICKFWIFWMLHSRPGPRWKQNEGAVADPGSHIGGSIFFSSSSLLSFFYSSSLLSSSSS